MRTAVQVVTERLIVAIPVQRCQLLLAKSYEGDPAEESQIRSIGQALPAPTPASSAVEIGTYRKAEMADAACRHFASSCRKRSANHT
ncbi:hypothetical protein HYPGJ_31168 [Hyphomicrobium sp. GJ21]|nr:hypothetical protein HYPGJ_31168 [Hyphomicrobium sp. GJ21]